MEDRHGRRNTLDRDAGRAVLPGGGGGLRPAADRLADTNVRRARRVRPGDRIARALGAIPAGRATLIAATLAIGGGLPATAAGDGTAERAQVSVAERDESPGSEIRRR